jgi:hypothetical protein
MAIDIREILPGPYREALINNAGYDVRVRFKGEGNKWGRGFPWLCRWPHGWTAHHAAIDWAIQQGADVIRLRLEAPFHAHEYGPKWHYCRYCYRTFRAGDDQKRRAACCGKGLVPVPSRLKEITVIVTGPTTKAHRQRMMAAELEKIRGNDGR